MTINHYSQGLIFPDWCRSLSMHYMSAKKHADAAAKVEMYICKWQCKSVFNAGRICSKPNKVLASGTRVKPIMGSKMITSYSFIPAGGSEPCTDGSQKTHSPPRPKHIVEPQRRFFVECTHVYIVRVYVYSYAWVYFIHIHTRCPMCASQLAIGTSKIRQPQKAESGILTLYIVNGGFP